MIVNGYKIEPDANLRDANLFGADLRGLDLRGADLRGADLRLAQVKGAKTAGIITDDTTRLPHDPIYDYKGDRAVWDHYVDRQKDGCHIWTGRRNSNHNTTDGDKYWYGQFNLEGCRSDMVHRQVFFLQTGEELPEDTHVSHTCESLDSDGNRLRLCVNPDHLLVGSAGSEKTLMTELL